MKFNGYIKKLNQLNIILISLILILPYGLFIHDLIFSNTLTNISDDDISSKEMLVIPSEWGHGRVSYNMVVGSCSYYSAGANIYWDFINHDNVDFRVLAMTGSQFSEAISGGPINYYSLLMIDIQGYGYFTVPSSGNWAIGFHNYDPSQTTTEIYFNVGGPTPYLRITRPSSTENLVKKDTIYMIEWTNYYVADTKLELWKGSNYISDISPYLLWTGFYPSYDWHVPESLEEDTDYRIKAINRVNPNIYDFSNYFEIYENDLINIIKPNSSSIFGTSTNQEILWTWRGLISSLDIELWNETNTIDQITSSPTECDGIYTWELPYNLSEGTNYRIKILNHDDPSLYNFSNFFTIYDASSPNIIIHEPDNYSITSQTPPNFNIEILELNLEEVWYQLQNDTFLTDIYSWEGQIEQNVWDQIGNGTIQVHIYANDSNGNLGYEKFVLYKDILSPLINIYEPTPSQLCGIQAPEITLVIIDPNLDKVWYSLNNGINITYIAQTYIDQAEWDKCSNGTVSMKIFATDTVGNIDFIEVLIRKDAYKPLIIIHSPIPDQKFKATAPLFNLSIIEETTTDNWYMISGNTEEFHFTYLTGSIDQIAWSELPKGLVELTFYARDEAGNIGSTSINIIKESSKDFAIPGYEFLLLIGIIGVFSIIKLINSNFLKKQQGGGD